MVIQINPRPSIMSQLFKPVKEMAMQKLGEKEEQQQKQQLANQYKQFIQTDEYKNLPIGEKASLSSLLFGSDLGKLVLEGEKAEQRSMLPENPEELSGLLQRFGMQKDQSKNMADLYGKLTTGGKTKFADILFDKIQRGEFSSGIKPEDFEHKETTITPGNITQRDKNKFDFPKIESFQGLTPKEKVQTQSELRKENLPAYKQATDKLKGFKDENLSLKQLENINKTDKLPKGMGRLNINWKSGELRIPAISNAETQLFVKTVNDFTVKAKDTFGARVTNFELQRFMQRLPTLANTKEGRELIIGQMKTINELNQLYHDSLKEVYRNYGMGNIDPGQAEMVAEDLRKDKEELLLNKYNSIVVKDFLKDTEKKEKANVLVEIDGKRGYVRKEELHKALKAGAKVL